MNNPIFNSYSSFDGYRRIASGPLHVAALAFKRAVEGAAAGPVLLFDDATGRSIDIDTRGPDEEVMARLVDSAETGEGADAPPPRHGGASEEDPALDVSADEPRRRGRPKLGVVAREVTLLPRHWDWLATQPGGASVALRKLVEHASRASNESDRLRKAQERAYYFMAALAGNLPGYEEATRALFANDRGRLEDLMAAWPADVRDHAIRLAFDGGPAA